MRRIGWLGVGLGVGLGAGAAGLRGLQGALQAVAPGQAKATLDDVERTIRAFADDVRVTMVQREADLRAALGIATTGEVLAAEHQEASVRGVR